MNTPVQIAPSIYGFSAGRGTALADGGAAGVHGAKVQLTASLDEDAIGLLVFPEGGGSLEGTIKLYVGAAAAEVEIAEVPQFTAANYHAALFVPVAVPKGSRVSASCASPSGFNTTYVHFSPIRGRSFDPVVSRGRMVGVAANGAWVDVDAGATANVEGAWAQITASTVRDAKGFTIVFGPDTSCDVNIRRYVDLAVGAAGSEIVILPKIPCSQEGYRGDVRAPSLGPIWTPIPAGTRIAARCMASSNAATSRVPRVALVLWE